MTLKKIYIISLILFSKFIFGQNIDMESKSIQSNFSLESIEAFQENSQNKLYEFYEYLNLYSKEKNEKLKEQIKENIFHLVQPDIKIQDLIDSKPNLIDLASFLLKIENKSYHFEVLSLEKPIDLGVNQWTNSYRLKVIQNGKSTKFYLQQIIHFEPEKKQFGSNGKSVWQVKLGSHKNSKISI